jgi:hypothetical protein
MSSNYNITPIRHRLTNRTKAILCDKLDCCTRAEHILTSKKLISEDRNVYHVCPLLYLRVLLKSKKILLHYYRKILTRNLKSLLVTFSILTDDALEKEYPDFGS